MIDSFIKGIGFALSGFSIVLQKGIRPFVVVPLLINTAVFSLAVWFAISQYNSLMAAYLTYDQ